MRNEIWGDDWPEVRRLWSLNPEVAHLNHGSFGAVPIPIQQEQRRWQEAAESNPMEFFARRVRDHLADARLRAATFLDADPGGLAFIPNATTGVNAVLASLRLGKGDDILITDHCYGAIQIAARRKCDESGAALRLARVPLEGASASDIVALISGAATEHTRLAIFDHISSPTATVFPAEDIVKDLSDRGIPTLVDGAHAVGTLPVDLSTLGATYWVGNFHKWVCAPRGSAALYIAPHARLTIKPLVSSWDEDEGFPFSFDWWGTDDFSDYLSVPAAIGLMESIGWDRIRRHNRELTEIGAAEIEKVSGLRRPEREIASMEIFQLPAGIADNREKAREFSRQISTELKIEVAASAWNDVGWMRISAHIYNHPEEYSRLASGLSRIL